jgi:guanylate kinase
MPRPVIVAGASGAGKSFLLEHLAAVDARLTVVRKKTTRPPRRFEQGYRKAVLDLEFSCSRVDLDKCDYRYEYGDHVYGVVRSQIDGVLRGGYNPVLIVRDCETIHLMKQDYPNALVLYLQSGLSGRDLEKKLRDQKRDDIEIVDRMERLQNDFVDYVKYVDIFDHILINYYDKDTLISQARTILRSELNQQQIDPDLIFVLMSFHPEMNEVYKAFCTAGRLIRGRNLRIKRIDSQKGDFRITDEILRNIEKAALVIADFTHERPNVYYELGYARGIGKYVLHCAKIGTKLHFDIKDFHTIMYESPMQLQDLIVEELADFYGQNQAIDFGFNAAN